MERRHRFIEAYIETVYRGAKAARIAGCPPAGARVSALRMLREPDVRAAIEAHWKEQKKRREAERLAREAADHLRLEAHLARIRRGLHR
jgi:phage terminase small subunit